MATCVNCKQSHFGMFELKGSFCKKCSEQVTKEDEIRKIRRANTADRKELNSIMLTTEVSSDLKIKERLGIVSAECAFGMNAFKDLFASVRDIVGGRSEAVQKTLRDSRNVALEELRLEAFELGGDAVVGVALNYVELSATGSMVLLVATGTAVKLHN